MMRLPGKPLRAPTLGLMVALGILLIDQASKWMLLEMAGFAETPRIIPVLPFCNIVLVWNRGVSFGMFSGAEQAMPYALSILALIIMTILMRWLLRTIRPYLGVLLGLVLGGAIGNVIDRLRFGAVVDFADFHVAGWHWPAFNVADAAISIGVALLLIDSLIPAKDKTP
ncbi:MAG: signal peptidase II [Alphaproteobacteria bacterium GWF2_58_20]|nr:MAG: signal peptidase II [Alphaproteobacteria bacterium GWF2_58_20]